jgi:hypothetical protein
LIVCSALLLCFTEVAAQSGRRKKKTTDPVSVPVNSQETTEPKPVAGPITSIIIGGHDIDPDTKEVWSNETSRVGKACRDRLKKQSKLGLDITYVGKMTKGVAQERAKKATSSYVLWFGYRSKLVGMEYVLDYIEYLVLLPQTGETLTEGRVFPAKQKASADPGGILRLPKRTGSKSNPRLLEQGGEDIADRVKGIL